MYSKYPNKFTAAKSFYFYNFWLVSCLLMLFIHNTESKDYCSLCDNHIACHNVGIFGTKCSPDRSMVKMTNDRKELILKLHNRMRNEIAMGKIPGYDPAAKMPSFQWSDELAYLAELNARSCNYGHDSCRATEKYRWAGQNIARRGNTAGYEKTSIAITNMVTDWFTEYKDANMKYINSFHNHDQGKKIGHFTVMVNDKNNAVGCAMIRHYLNKFKYHYFVCNYSFTNIYERPVYEVGTSGSKCKKPHLVYKGLCSADQKVDQNP